LTPTLIRQVPKNPIARASNETGVGKNGKNADFRPINVSETIGDRHTVTVEDED